MDLFTHTYVSVTSTVTQNLMLRSFLTLSLMHHVNEPLGINGTVAGRKVSLTP